MRIDVVSKRQHSPEKREGSPCYPGDVVSQMCHLMVSLAEHSSMHLSHITLPNLDLTDILCTGTMLCGFCYQCPYC